MNAYIAQIIEFEELQWEKLHIFLTYLNKKLPKKAKDALDITDVIDLDVFENQNDRKNLRLF